MNFYQKLLAQRETETIVEKEQEEKINKMFQDITDQARTQEPLKIDKTKLDKVMRNLKKNKAPDS